MDPARIALCRHSAGACLCAGLTLRARDEGGPALAFQQLLLPALDDRADGDSRTEIDDPRVHWAPTTNLARATVAHWTRALRDAPAEK